MDTPGNFVLIEARSSAASPRSAPLGGTGLQWTYRIPGQAVSERNAGVAAASFESVDCLAADVEEIGQMGLAPAVDSQFLQPILHQSGAKS